MKTVALTSQVVSAFVSHNPIRADDLPDLIQQVHSALNLREAEPAANERQSERPSAAQIRRSIRPDALISFEDGRPYKLLKRHLATLGLTPEAYREKWGLPRDYPMAAPNYSAARSEMAKTAGLGTKTRGRSR